MLMKSKQFKSTETDRENWWLIIHMGIIWESEISIESIATLTQSLTNFHKTEEKKSSRKGEKDRGDMVHVKNRWKLQNNFDKK